MRTRTSIQQQLSALIRFHFGAITMTTGATLKARSGLDRATILSSNTTTTDTNQTGTLQAANLTDNRTWTLPDVITGTLALATNVVQSFTLQNNDANLAGNGTTAAINAALVAQANNGIAAANDVRGGATLRIVQNGNNANTDNEAGPGLYVNTNSVWMRVLENVPDISRLATPSEHRQHQLLVGSQMFRVQTIWVFFPRHTANRWCYSSR